LAESDSACEQGLKDLKWLNAQHEEAQLELANLKKEHAGIKKELWVRKDETANMKERHRHKVDKLTTEM
jgi:hypothetical protein